MGITSLSPMQQVVARQVATVGNFVVYAPTGSGKTIAYCLAMLPRLKNDVHGVQLVVLVPTRELAIQTTQVIRTLGSGLKCVALYGGHRFIDEQNALQARPAVVVATPGRLFDHIQRGNMVFSQVRNMVIDEFDKCLEIGFEHEIRNILRQMHQRNTTVLTSATPLDTIPHYVADSLTGEFNFLDSEGTQKPEIRQLVMQSADADKLESLRSCLLTFVGERAIVFVNHRESVERVAKFLTHNAVDAGMYHGKLDQIQREKAIAMFENGTYPILVCTDLAARGLDVEDVGLVVHYHLPLTEQAYVHRNGRTARFGKRGTAIVILGPNEELPPFIDDARHWGAAPCCKAIRAQWGTIFLNAGRKEKISRADILGAISNNIPILEPKEVGKIHLADHYTLVAVPLGKLHATIEMLNSIKVKGRRLRASLAQV